MDAFIKKLLTMYLLRKKRAEYASNSPYSVDRVDHFKAGDEYGYDLVGSFNDLQEAIKVARKIAEDSLASRVGGWDLFGKGDLLAWRGQGVSGLVYDSHKELVWSGSLEYGEAENIKRLMENETNGLNRVMQAIEFAANAHASQVRKGTNIPYIVHPIRVAEILARFYCFSQPVLIAGVLHDTREDTSVKAAEIRNQFGEKVCEIVESVSEMNKKDDWKTRKLRTINLLKNAPLDVLWVEAADKLDNIMAIRHDFSELGDKVWERFNASKEDIQWYYQSLADVFVDRKKDNRHLSGLIAQFNTHVEAVFPKDKTQQSHGAEVVSMDHYEEMIPKVKELTIRRSTDNGQFIIEADRQEDVSRLVLLPGVTNFEWRMDKPVAITHLYLGNETDKKDGCELRVTFNKRQNIDISSPDARCYIRIAKPNK